MIPTDFSIIRRTTGLVDVLFKKQAGVKGYKLQGSPQFDGSPAFVDLFTADIGSGYLDPAVDRRGLHAVPEQNFVRAAFNPTTFNGAAGIQDSAQFWLRFVPVDFSGTPGTAQPPVLVLTPAQANGTARVVVAGDAPLAASVDLGLKFYLARRMKDIVIRNTSGGTLFVAFEENSAELAIPVNTTYTGYSSAQSMVSVRATGSIASFDLSCTVAQGTV